MISINTILVPTDFSDHSDKAVQYGVELAQKFGASLHVIHAYETVPIAYGEAGYVPVETPAEVKQAATEHLNNMEIAGDDGLSVHREVIEGHPFVEIVRYAKEKSADLIVLGTHGRGAIAHMLLGSVAEKVVRKAPCPVLVVRDQEHDFVMP